MTMLRDHSNGSLEEPYPKVGIGMAFSVPIINTTLNIGSYWLESQTIKSLEK